MRRFRSLLCLLILGSGLSACDGFFLVVSTGPLPAQRQSPIPTPATVIVVGDVVRSTFVVPQVCFNVRAPATGILFVNLSWDPHDGDIDVTFVSTVGVTAMTTVTSVQGSAVRSLRVTNGQTYQLP